MTTVEDPIVSQVLAKMAEAEQEGATALAHVGRRIRRCIDIGDILSKQKEALGHGQWTRWFDANIANQEVAQRASFTIRTAERYMKLASLEASGLLDLDKASSVRQAFVLAGILPSSGGETNAGDENPQPALLVALKRMETKLNSELTRKPLEEWTTDEKRLWQDRLAPFVDVWKRLSA